MIRGKRKKVESMRYEQEEKEVEKKQNFEDLFGRTSYQFGHRHSA